MFYSTYTYSDRWSLSTIITHGLKILNRPIVADHGIDHRSASTNFIRVKYMLGNNYT